MSDTTPVKRERATKAVAATAPAATGPATPPVAALVGEAPAVKAPVEPVAETIVASEVPAALPATAPMAVAAPETAPAPVAAAPARKAKAAARVSPAKAVEKPAVPAAAPREARSVPAPKAPSKPVLKSLPNKNKAIPAAAKRPAAAQKGYLDMLNPTETTKQAAEKVQAFFVDANDKAKAAFEKSAKLGEEFAALTKGNVEAFVESSKVAAKGAETLGQEAAEYGKKTFEHASSTFKSMTGVKSPTELFQLQSEFAKSSFDNAVAEASKFSEAWMKLAGDVFQPLSNRYAVAAEKFKSAAF
ncbi:phasin family protein [Sphingomonas laterariae]|uniref:Phasin family protein n=1 Tax=Edaphosphingomonas laterariae TaxID=861865 RepID=A0A239F5P6_9SPHN|nr:phasin family protein [Sphingomonas laterariae]SNS52226.1 phasin family protein [Sphingomonas laterariae]